MVGCRSIELMAVDGGLMRCQRLRGLKKARATGR